MAVLTETKGGLRVFKPDVAKYVQVMLGNLYTQLPVGEPVLQLDGVWTYAALTPNLFKNRTGKDPDGPTAYDFMQSRKKGTYVLLDAEAVAANLEGNEVPITLMVVNNRQLAKQLTDDPTSAMAVIDPLTSAEAEKKKGKYSPILMAAAAGAGGLVVGGPVVGAAAAAGTYLLTA